MLGGNAFLVCEIYEAFDMCALRVHSKIVLGTCRTSKQMQGLDCHDDVTSEGLEIALGTCRTNADARTKQS
jgi:hypothetical protein